MERDWTRLGRLVHERRELLNLPQGVGKVSAATWRKVEKAIDPPYTRRKLVQIFVALGWDPDSVDHVLDGGEPSDANSEPTDVSAAIVDINRRLDVIELMVGITRQADESSSDAELEAPPDMSDPHEARLVKIWEGATDDDQFREYLIAIREMKRRAAVRPAG